MKIKLLSWNIYFDDESGNERYPAILQILERSEADIIFLQEVTDQFLETLFKTRKLSNYKFFNIDNNQSYRNIILSRVTVAHSCSIVLPSNMNREVPFVDINISNVVHRFASIHLESLLTDYSMRCDQIKLLVKNFSEQTNSFFLCGDVNFGDEDLENNLVNEYFYDLCREDHRFTYDTENNILASQTKFPNEESRRLDRFLSSSKVLSSNYCILDSVYSDHYAISVELVL